MSISQLSASAPPTSSGPQKLSRSSFDARPEADLFAALAAASEQASGRGGPSSFAFAAGKPTPEEAPAPPLPMPPGKTASWAAPLPVIADMKGAEWAAPLPIDSPKPPDLAAPLPIESSEKRALAMPLPMPVDETPEWSAPLPVDTETASPDDRDFTTSLHWISERLRAAALYGQAARS